MKKLISLIGIASLSLIMSLSFSASHTSASSLNSSELTDDVTQLATSRFIVYDKVYAGRASPPNTYNYSDSYGYKGTLRLQFYIYSPESNTTSARYEGTITCNGTCVSPSDKPAQDK